MSLQIRPSLSHAKGTTTLASSTYTLGATGNRVRLVEGDGSSTQWTYDDADRLLSETFTPSSGTVAQTSFTYDAVGNRLTETRAGSTTTSTYNALDQRISAGSTQYQYDDRGNLTRVTEGTRVTQYAYDTRDRLISVTLPGGSQESYGYDADGRRVQRTAGTTVTHALWDERSAYGDIVLESDASGTPQASYVLADGELLAQARGTATHYVLHDGQGSVRALADTTGAVTDHFRYDAFGAERERQGNTVTPYQYTGQYRDATTDLYSLRARFYDPGQGRFLSRDPAPVNTGNPFELNRYTYVANNPVNLVDPTGWVAIPGYGLRLSTGAGSMRRARPPC